MQNKIIESADTMRLRFRFLYATSELFLTKIKKRNIINTIFSRSIYFRNKKELQLGNVDR